MLFGYCIIIYCKRQPNDKPGKAFMDASRATLITTVAEDADLTRHAQSISRRSSTTAAKPYGALVPSQRRS